jgi:predicted small secreted protein
MAACMSPRIRWSLLPLLVLSAFALSGCMQGVGQGAVSNATDSFSYGGQVAGKDDATTFTWKVTGSTVMVSWGGQSAQGHVDLTLRDGAGNQVYVRSFGGTQQGGASETLHNVKAGDWKVTLAFHAFTGQMGLSLQATGSGGAGSHCPPNVPYC